MDALGRGFSIAIAPEGTRSPTTRLGDFRKGAFHIAMQAGVPIVPIVIRNSGDVMPKGSAIYHPATVEVDVLPPVDTSEWRVENIDSHIEQVRDMFLDALGQDRGGHLVRPRLVK